MGFKIKNSLTGEFEKLPILTLKGEKGETGGVEEYNKVDYMGNKYETLKQANDANVEYAVKTAIGEFNYLDYEGQHITATNSIEGRTKSAILKGRTLVNVLDKTKLKTANNATIVDNVITIDNTKAYSRADIYNTQNLIKDSTRYLLILKDVSGDATGLVIDVNGKMIGFNQNNYAIITINGADPTGRYFWVQRKNPSTSSTTTDTVSFKLMLIEYIEGMENWDIPYFEGMQSVRMPVLTTCGKNLVDMNRSYDNVTNAQATVIQNIDEITVSSAESGTYVNANFVLDKNFFKGKTVTGSCLYESDMKGIGTVQINYQDTTGKKYYQSIKTSRTFTFPDEFIGEVLLCVYANNTNTPQSNTVTVKNIQLELGSTATSYELHKSNILSIDGEYRGIGDICDTVDVGTGEYVQRCGEIITNNLEPGDFYMYNDETLETTIKFGMQARMINKLLAKTNAKCVCNTIPTMPGNADVFHMRFDGGSPYGGLTIWIEKDKLESNDITGLVKWLRDNNTVIQYEFATPTIKTVDLSDNVVYSYNGTTHYTCSSEEGSLVPTLSIKVPTNVQATIAQQRETIQTLNSENERLNQIQEALKASMLDSQVQLMNLSWDTDFEVFTLRESIAPKDFLLDSRTGSNIDKFSQAKFIIENDCPDLEKLNSQIEYYFSKDVFSQEQFEELTDLISIVKGENGCEY